MYRSRVTVELVIVMASSLVTRGARVRAARTASTDIGSRDLALERRRADCPTKSVRAEWNALGLFLAKKKSNGRAYVGCVNNPETTYKVSCLKEECDGDDWCFVENHCGGSWLFSNACEKLPHFDLHCVQHQEVLPLKAWALVGLTSFSVAPGLGDWFSKSDVYAEVTVQPSSRTYRSKVFWNRILGDFDMHLFVPQTETSVEVVIHDKDVVTSDDHIGHCTVRLQDERGEFEKTLTADSDDEVILGTVKGYVAVGEQAVRDAHDALIARGIQPIMGDPEQGSRYSVVKISNDQVEHELAYAKTGSVIPESLHGIWWMDQRGIHLPIPSEPEYKQVCESAADELVVTFGEGHWDPKTRCLNNVWVWGGSPRGHWVFMNNGDDQSDLWDGAFAGKLSGHFCFRDETLQRIDLKLLVKAGDVLEAVVGLNLPEPVDGFIELPRAILSMNMVKKPWGWDRETVAGPDMRLLRDALKVDMFAFLDDVNPICHYPVFQIVDGDGKRTEHYDAYLAWAGTNFPQCESSTFDCPVMNGNGTSLVARLVG